jgi:hypothetical protein
MSRRVYIGQCLCGPNRDAIFGLAAEFNNEAEAEATLIQQMHEAVDGLLENGAVKPWCAICGAAREGWRFEVGRTRFATMEEAQPELAKSQVGNLLANLLFGTHGSQPPKKQ